MLNLFFSYSHKDELLRDALEVHLSVLKRQGAIAPWHDRCLRPGSDLDDGILAQLEAADIILFLVSPDFIASEYCYGREMTRALERADAGEAEVLPIILRPCEWLQTPLSARVAAPADGRPVTKWPDQDEAFLDVARAIRRLVEERAPVQPAQSAVIAEAAQPVVARPAGPRSSNMRVHRVPTQQEKDRFQEETFAYVRDFVRNSLEELDARHEDVGTRFRKIDADRFTGTIYRNGAVLGGFTIFCGNGHMDGILFSGRPDAGTNSWNESFHVVEGETGLAMRPMGMSFHARTKEANLTPLGTAEFLWELIMEPLQR